MRGSAIVFAMKIREKIQACLLPASCVLCAVPTQRALSLCQACEKELPWLKAVCMRCALPLAGTYTGDDMLCGHCIQQSVPFAATTALFYYQKPIDSFITALKFNQQLLYARLLGELLAQRLSQRSLDTQWPDSLIPMPLHPKRLRERGFNQALEIARPIAKKFKLPLDIQHCQRIRFTPFQSALPAAERHRNVKNAFQVSPHFKAKYVVIIDDVVTTGHTVTELAYALRRVGVERIEVWCIARTE